MAHAVVGARVGGVHAGLAGLAAARVAGERAVERGGAGVAGNPFGAVHLGGAEPVAGLARLDEQLALARKAGGGVQAALPGGECQPLPAAVGIEARHVERAVVEQLAVGRKAAGAHRVARDKFVDVLKARVLAHVDHGAAIDGLHHERTFVRGAAERGALDGRAGRVEGVDLHHPAVAVELIGVARGVEALVVLVPAVAVALRPQAPAPRMRVGLGRAVEVADEVFFAGEVGAPGRYAVGAVVEGAAYLRAAGVERGAHERVAGGRALQAHRRGGGDAARVAARAQHRPAALGVALHFDDRHAVRGLRLGHLFGAPRRRAVGVQQALIGVLVVDHQQAALALRRAFERKEMHAVVVHAGLQRLLGGAVAAVGAKCRQPGRQPRRTDGVAPGVDGLGHVTGRHQYGVGARHRHAGEAEQPRRRRAHAGRQRSQQGARGGQAAAQHHAPRRIAKRVDVGIGRGVGILQGRKVLHARIL